MDSLEFSRKGGNTTKRRYGSKHFSEIGTKGAASKKTIYGDDYYKRIRRGEKPSQDTRAV